MGARNWQFLLSRSVATKCRELLYNVRRDRKEFIYSLVKQQMLEIVISFGPCITWRSNLQTVASLWVECYQLDSHLRRCTAYEAEETLQYDSEAHTELACHSNILIRTVPLNRGKIISAINTIWWVKPLVLTAFPWKGFITNLPVLVDLLFPLLRRIVGFKNSETRRKGGCFWKFRRGTYRCVASEVDLAKIILSSLDYRSTYSSLILARFPTASTCNLSGVFHTGRHSGEPTSRYQSDSNVKA